MRGGENESGGDVWQRGGESGVPVIGEREIVRPH